jgi:hypothetical protein
VTTSSVTTRSTSTATLTSNQNQVTPAT